MRRAIRLLPLALVIAAGCGGDGDDDEATTAAATAATATTAEATVVADDIPAPGDPCDGNDYGEAVEWPANLDCDDKAGEVVAAGQKCSRGLGDSITTLAQKLECETGRNVGRGKWIIYDPSAPDTANPSVPVKPVQEGDPCVPGQDLPPGYVCE